MPQVRQARRAPVKRAPAPRTRQRAAPRRADGSGWTMKLGAWAHARMRAAQHDNLTRRLLMGATAVSVVVILLVLAAGLGVLDNMGRSISTTAANTARSMGLAVRVVNVQAPIGLPMSEYQRAEAEAIAGIIPDDVMFAVNPAEIRARVAELPWVEDVMVRRLWPDQIQIVITPRPATALWQENGKLTYMDATGRKLGPANVTSAKGYALVVGANAGPAAPALFAALAPYKEVSNRTSAAIRVGDRRWTLRLKSGADVLLPEHDMPSAIAQLNQLQISHKLLDRSFAQLDMKTPGTLILRPTTEVASVIAAQSATKPARGV
jgi:cell division protein FtsQ